MYQGDLMNEEQVLEWLTSESIDMHDKIELATAKSLPGIIDNQDYVAVLFCEHCLICQAVGTLRILSLTKCLFIYLLCFPFQSVDPDNKQTT